MIQRRAGVRRILYIHPAIYTPPVHKPSLRAGGAPRSAWFPADARATPGGRRPQEVP